MVTKLTPIVYQRGEICYRGPFLLVFPVRAGVCEHSSVVERCPDKTEVLGSIPSARTNVSFGRASVCTAAYASWNRSPERCESFRLAARAGPWRRVARRRYETVRGFQVLIGKEICVTAQAFHFGATSVYTGRIDDPGSTKARHSSRAQRRCGTARGME